METAELCARIVAATYVRKCNKIIFISTCSYILFVVYIKIL